MSDDASAILRSNHGPASSKRRRAEGSYSGGSTGRSGCRYGGCGRLEGLEDGTFCSKAHRDYFMGELYDGVKNGGAYLTQKPNGICMFPRCGKAVWVVDSATGERYDFCRLGHALEYRKKITEQWAADDRLCKFENCTRHVHVDETTKTIGEYCSRSHLFDAAAASVKRGIAERKESAAPKEDSLNAHDPQSDELPITDSDENQERSISKGAPQWPMQPKIDIQRGYHEKVAGPEMLNCLIYLLKNPGDFSNADPKGLFCIQNIGDCHPFDEVTEFGGFKPKWYLHYIDSTPGKLKSRSTTQGFRWKQSGPPNSHKNKTMSEYEGLQTTYYHYERPETGYKDDHCDEPVVAAYREYEEQYNAGKLTRRTRKRWRMSQFSLTDNLIKKVIGVELPKREKIPVISKIWQERTGLPVWPPDQQGKEKSAPLGSIPDATGHVEQMIMSSVASNGAPPGDPTFQRGNANEVTANESNAPVIVNPFREETAPVEDRGMIGSIDSNTSPPGEEDMLPQWEFDLSDFDEFPMDLSTFADERNETVTGVPFSRFQEDGGMTSSSSSNASLSDDLPDHLFYQPQVVGEYILRAYLGAR